MLLFYMDLFLCNTLNISFVAYLPFLICISHRKRTRNDVSKELIIFVWVSNDHFSPSSNSQNSDKILRIYEFIWCMWIEPPDLTHFTSEWPSWPQILFLKCKGFILGIVYMMWHPSFFILSYLIVDNWIIFHNICTGYWCGFSLKPVALIYG